MVDLGVILSGLGRDPEITYTVARAATGLFFAISGAHKLFVPARHAALVATLRASGIPGISVMQWWVPFWELTAGLAFMLGLLTVPAGFILAIILTVACVTDGRQRVESFKPFDVADRIDSWLYLCEIVYLMLLAIIVVRGPDYYSLDHLLWGL